MCLTLIEIRATQRALIYSSKIHCDCIYIECAFVWTTASSLLWVCSMESALLDVRISYYKKKLFSVKLVDQEIRRSQIVFLVVSRSRSIPTTEHFAGSF